MSNASVPQIARRLHAQCLLEDSDPPKLLPVQLSNRTMASGVIELNFAEVKLRIEGSPDPTTLLIVLDKVFG
jgi:hypothetical protein